MRPWTVQTVRAVVTCLPDVDGQGWLLPKMPADLIGAARVVEHNTRASGRLGVPTSTFNPSSLFWFQFNVVFSVLSDGNSVIKSRGNLRFAAIATKNKPMESSPRRPVTVSFREAVLRVRLMLCEAWLVQHPRKPMPRAIRQPLVRPWPKRLAGSRDLCMLSVPQTLDRPTPASTSISHSSGTTGEG
jgi:hypothetical protein